MKHTASRVKDKVLKIVGGLSRNHQAKHIVPAVFAILVATVGIRMLFPSHAASLCRTIPLTESAIRQALVDGGSICLPAGTVEITKPLRVTQSNTKITGAGQDVTVLRMNFPESGINYGPMIAIPGEWSTDFGGGNPPPESMRVSGVEISDLSIDGARQGNPNTYGSAQATTIRFGIQSTVSTDTYLHNLHIYDIAGDAIGFGNGNGVNIRPKVEDVLIERAGRNGIHLGNAEDAVIRRSKILDTPGVYWQGAGAGNGIDIEVEGQDPHVFRTVIEDNEISRFNAGFAGFGIQVTRAFGDVNDIVIQRNTFKNHQQGVLLASTTNARVINNTFLSDTDNYVTGGGVGLIANPGYPADAYVAFNTFSLENWHFCDNVVNANGSGNWRVEDNIMLGCDKVFMAYGEPSHIDSARNQYRTNNNGLFFNNSLQPASTITDSGSTVTTTNPTQPPPVPPPPASDTTNPTVSLTSPANASSISGTTTASATASDNVRVTKVEFYLDSNLQSTAASAPYNWNWNTASASNGSHSVQAKAYDAAGNVGSSSSVTVTVANGGGSISAGTALITAVTPSANSRKDFGGWVGYRITVGSVDVSVSSLGRYVLSDNNTVHTVKLVSVATGADVPGGSAAVVTNGKPAGSFSYTDLANPVSLKANASYYLVSQETVGGDLWYNYDNRLTTTNVAAVDGPVYDSSNTWNFSALPGQGYGPGSLRYTAGSTTPAYPLSDTNHDGKVNFDDALYVIRKWSTPDTTADVNQDGSVNFDDALLLIRNWKN